MFERNCILHSLLEDAIERLRVSNKSLGDRLILNSLADSTSLLFKDDCRDEIENSRDYFDINKPPDFVYLDPMYPQGTVGKKSNVKKETQMLRRLVGECEGEDEMNNSALFEAAISKALSRVVVKRPLNADPICGEKPSSSLEGSNQRFDIYTIY